MNFVDEVLWYGMVWYVRLRNVVEEQKMLSQDYRTLVQCL